MTRLAFWLGMPLVSVTLGLLAEQGFNTASEWDPFHSLLLPAVTLGHCQAAQIA